MTREIEIPSEPVPQADFPQYEQSEEASQAPLEAPADADESEVEDPNALPIYPVGKLVESGRREAYVSGDMLLEVPRLNLSCPVLDGTETETLDQGVCLFEYAQLPGVSNANTSLVAHRDVYGKEFLNIHKITDGDLMYLTYEGKKYTYEYSETLVTDDSDWEPIRVKDFACITLQSCDPIGTAINRIFVIGRLIGEEDVAS